MTKPNVLILMCDQMQAKRMGFIDGIAYTPNLDALAAEGVHFKNAITVNGQCVPSRCSFATGMSPHETNVMVNFGFHGHCGTLTPQSRTFAHDFQEAGYTTAHFGKSHLGAPLRTLGFDVGECLDGNFPEGQEPIERIQVREASKAAGGDGHKAEGEKKSCHYKALDDGLAWLEEYQPGDEPLLFMYDTNLPHPPFYSETEWQDRFKPEEMVLPKSYYEETFDGKPAFMVERSRKYPILDDEAAVKAELAQYYTMISAVDKACGQFIDLFKRKGMWENTIVLFFTDHGDMMGGHRLRFKGTYPYEELYNIPCIMKLPAGLERKRVTIEEPVISTDLPGALLHLAGVEPSPQFATSGVTQALQRKAPNGDECAFFEHYAAWWGIHPFYGARTATMKYVRYYGDEHFEEMYDLVKDPHELHSVANDPDYQLQRTDLSARADAWWRETGGKDADYYASDAFRDGLNR
ncbi:MAG: sulfatase-like hydrolase/transferase [Verrucomicrobia bacterium]|nr:sulfatase-like hydrolase/transferase [Verrucomicrobiota bacterium]MBT7068414.1 sulfatase-like hydrolase/transferase [Verrucomicrobiota bacterium]MBT7700237.1 sulfatase-like hydrolase/transferase [Verrucomicrobiota bacterium]